MTIPEGGVAVYYNPRFSLGFEAKARLDGFA